MTLFKDMRRGTWRYSFQFQGQRYPSGDFPTKGTARTKEEEHRKQLKSQQGKQIHQGMGFREMANLYLDYAERRFAKQTYNYKAFVFRCFLTHYGDIPVNQLTPHQIEIYLGTRPTNHNYNAHRKELGALFTWANKKLKLKIQNPALENERMPHTPKVKDIPSQDEIMRLIVAATPGDEKDIIMCCLHTLGRIDEILRITWADVNFEKRTVTLWTRKRKDGSYEPDDLPINPDLYEVLLRRWNERKQDKFVFFNDQTGDRFYHRPKMMRSICERAGIKPYGFHSIRHFMASYLADKEKISKKVISDLLRHRSLQTTEIYLHSIDESVRMAMENISFSEKLHATLTRKGELQNKNG